MVRHLANLLRSGFLKSRVSNSQDWIIFFLKSKKINKYNIYLFLVISIIIFMIFNYYSDIIWIRAKFYAIKNVNNIELRGYDDLHFHIHSVYFEVDGKPGSTIGIWVPREGLGLMGRPRHLYLARLGPYDFACGAGTVGEHEMTKGEPLKNSYWTPWIDIGTAGEFQTILPIKINDIQDIVSNYDKLKQYFASWPEEKSKLELVTTSGRRIAYYRTSASTDQN